MDTCIEETCARPAVIRKMCRMHYRHWSFTDEGREMFIKDPRVNGRKEKDDVGYNGAHHRVKRVKGLASDHACIDCAGTAEGWSLKHDGDLQVDMVGLSAGKLFSRDIDDYEPRCDDCHRIYDIKHGLMRKGLPEDYIKSFKPQTEAKAAQMVEMVKAGMSVIEVGKALGVNKSTVTRFFAQHEGISIREWKKSQLN